MAHLVGTHTVGAVPCFATWQTIRAWCADIPATIDAGLDTIFYVVIAFGWNAKTVTTHAAGAIGSSDAGKPIITRRT